jgi:LysM repeat protein
MAHPQSAVRRSGRTAVLLAALAAAGGVAAQTLPVTPQQRATAQQVAQSGVPLADLAPNAPDSYTVKSGDTLWGISKMFLASPWRWPELWGMNMQEVRNPHLIYPGQHLVLEKDGERARLRLAQARPGGAGGIDSPPTDTIRVSPRVRIQTLSQQPLPTLRPQSIEPFLAEPLIVGAGVLEAAPRIVAGPDDRVLLTRGDRIYVRSSGGAPLATNARGPSPEFRVFRNAVPLRDPITKAVLGYEAQYLGQAELQRGEGTETVASSEGSRTVPMPASLDIKSARSEMRVGDRLLPEPGRQLVSYVPRAPASQVNGSIVSMYGEAVALAGENQVVVINKGTADGVESGHVLAILKNGAELADRTEPANRRSTIKLPNERNGLLMVFRPFEHLSYALVLETTDGVKVGDRVINPR